MRTRREIGEDLRENRRSWMEVHTELLLDIRELLEQFQSSKEQTVETKTPLTLDPDLVYKHGTEKKP
jgi:hypothetical protein